MQADLAYAMTFLRVLLLGFEVTFSLPLNDAESEEGEESEGEGDPLAEIQGELQLGSTLAVVVPEQLAPASASESLSYRWHRSPDGESWELVEGEAGEADAGRFLLTAEEVGCFVFVEWFVTSEGGAGEVLREGASEMSASAVRLLPEDREDLKSALLKGEISQELRSPQGDATLRVAASGVRLSHRFGGTETIELSPSVLRVDLSDPAALRLMRSADDVAADGVRCVCDTQQRDLLVLVARALSATQNEATQEGGCQVWEGEGYVDYYGRLHGQVILLYEGTAPPVGDAAATEALVLHGCTAEMVAPLPEP